MGNDAPTMLQIIRHGEGGHVVEVALDRPGSLNAVSTAFAREIAAVTGDLAADPTVRAVVLTSTQDKAFCVGADLKERNSFADADLMDQRLVTRPAYGGVLALPMPLPRSSAVRTLGAQLVPYQATSTSSVENRWPSRY